MKEVIPVLALYWGAKIKYDYLVGKSKRSTHNAVIDLENLNILSEHEISNLYVYLKPLTALQPVDLLTIVQLITGDEEVKFEYEKFDEDDGFSVFNSMVWIDIYTDPFAIYATYRESGDDYIIRNMVTIIDYLRKKHFDLNGLIQRGLAVEIS